MSSEMDDQGQAELPGARIFLELFLEKDTWISPRKTAETALKSSKSSQVKAPFPT